MNGDTQIIIDNLKELKKDLTKKMDDNHTELKKTLYGEDGTGGICQKINTHELILFGRGEEKGIVGDIEVMKSEQSNQGIWNKGLGGGQFITWVVLAVKSWMGIGQ